MASVPERQRATWSRVVLSASHSRGLVAPAESLEATSRSSAPRPRRRGASLLCHSGWLADGATCPASSISAALISSGVDAEEVGTSSTGPSSADARPAPPAEHLEHQATNASRIHLIVCALQTTTHPALILCEAPRDARRHRRIPATQESESPANDRNPRLIPPSPQAPRPACHAGGRGFESRRSRLETPLQISNFCCRSRHQSGVLWSIRGPSLRRKVPANRVFRSPLVRRSHKHNQVIGRVTAGWPRRWLRVAGRRSRRRPHRALAVGVVSCRRDVRQLIRPEDKQERILLRHASRFVGRANSCSLLKLFFSSCLIRSRVTSKVRPSSSSVAGWPPSSP